LCGHPKRCVIEGQHSIGLDLSHSLLDVPPQPLDAVLRSRDIDDPDAAQTPGGGSMAASSQQCHVHPGAL
jgi:hypothetical protein